MKNQIRKVWYLFIDFPGFVGTKIREAGCGFWLRFAVLLVTVLGGVACLGLGGVEFSQAPGPYDGPTMFYYTLGLFAFSGIDLGIPQGGEPFAIYVLWAIYFLAPTITFSALVEAVTYFKGLELWQVGLCDHVVIGGYGRLAQVFIERERDKSTNSKKTVVVVERHSENSDLKILSQEPSTQMLIGDVSNESVLKKLRLERAREVFLLTGDDQANLDAALCIRQLREEAKNPSREFQIWTHVSNLSLLRRLESNKLVEETAFNGYRVAARQLVKDKLIRFFDETTERNSVVLAGFGRFGQTVLNELWQWAQGKFGTVIIIDRNAEHLFEVYKQDVGLEMNDRVRPWWGRRMVQVLEADTRDPKTWKQVKKKTGPPDPPPIFVLACGPDKINIQTALALFKKDRHARIYARCFRKSLFTDIVCERGDFEIFSPGELLRRCDDDQLRARDNNLLESTVPRTE